MIKGEIIKELEPYMEKCLICNHKFIANDCFIVGVRNYNIFVCCRECLDQPLMSRTTYLYKPDNEQTKLF